MKFSLLQSTRDNRPRTVELGWPEFATSLGNVWGEFPDKVARDASAPLWLPATFNGGRKMANVEAVHALVLDIDGAGHEGVPLAEWFRVLHLASPFVSLAHTSFSHEPQRETVCGRLVVLPSRPVLPHEWPIVRPAFVRFFGGISDPKTDDPTRCYFLPIVRPGRHAEFMAWRSDGMAGWDVDAAMLAAPVAPGAIVPAAPRVHHAGDPIPADLVKRLAKRLKGRSEPRDARAGHLIETGLDGFSLAAPGARDDTLFLIACKLAEAFPMGDANGIAELFRNALGMMASEAPGCPTVEQFAEKIARKQSEIHAKHDEQEQKPIQLAAKHASLAFEELGVRRAHAYAPEEIAAFESEAGPLANRWILQRGKAFWIFFAGEYRECTREDLPNAAPQYLAPAVSAGVALHKFGPDGERVPKTHVELVSEYGRVLKDVEFDLAGVRSRLENGVLRLESARLRYVEPKYNPDVQHWLELFAGPRVDALLDWIATVSWIRVPVPALYLKGARGVGKGLLVSGLSRLWAPCIPTPLADAMSNFNGKILDCPLVFGDEQIPESIPGKPDVDPLKSLISASEHVINRKFRDPVIARGALRIVLAANNLRLLRHTQTRDDAEALADRLCIISPQHAAREWLEQRGGYAFTRPWIENDALAQHARWLELQRRETFTRGRRFLLPGSDLSVMMSILTGAGARWGVCRWIVSFLQSPTLHQQARPGVAPAAVVGNGRVWINVANLRACWDHYLPGDRVPSTEEVTRACGELLQSGPENRTPYMGAVYQAMRHDALAGWVDDNEPDLALGPLLATG